MVQFISIFILFFGVFLSGQSSHAVSLTQICSQPARLLTEQEKVKCVPVHELWAAYRSYYQSVEKANQYKTDNPTLTCYRYMKNIASLHNQYLASYQMANQFYLEHSENFALVHIAKMEILSIVHQTLYEIAIQGFEGGFIEDSKNFELSGQHCMTANREAWLEDVKDRQQKMDLLRSNILRFISKKYTDTVPQLFIQREDQLRNILTGQALFKQVAFALTIWHAVSFKKILLGLRIATTVGAVAFAGDDRISNNLKSMDFNFYSLSNSEESKRKGREAIRASFKNLDSDTYSSFLDSVKVIVSASPQYDVYLQMFQDMEKMRKRSTALSNNKLEAAKEILK